MNDEQLGRLPPPPFWRTNYYQNVVLPKPGREVVEQDDIVRALAQPVARRFQDNGRWQIWVRASDDRHWLSVILLGDGETVHNAFFDRRFRPWTSTT